jgi:hypothetical protein
MPPYYSRMGLRPFFVAVLVVWCLFYTSQVHYLQLNDFHAAKTVANLVAKHQEHPHEDAAPTQNNHEHLVDAVLKTMVRLHFFCAFSLY